MPTATGRRAIPFAVLWGDGSGHDALRDGLFDAQKTALKNQTHRLGLDGATLNTAGRPSGSLYIVNVKDAIAICRCDADPFTGQGVLLSIAISQYMHSFD